MFIFLHINSSIYFSKMFFAISFLFLILYLRSEHKYSILLFVCDCSFLNPLLWWTIIFANLFTKQDFGHDGYSSDLITVSNSIFSNKEFASVKLYGLKCYIYLLLPSLTTAISHFTLVSSSSYYMDY